MEPLLLKGLATVRRKMAKAVRDQLKRTERALVRASLFLQRESQKVCPVEFGVLKNSAFTRLEVPAPAPVIKVRVGYTAAYAIFVHENLDALHGAAYNAFYADEIAKGLKKNRGKNQQAKFLEGPARLHRVEIARRIREGSRKK